MAEVTKLRRLALAFAKKVATTLGGDQSKYDALKDILAGYCSGPGEDSGELNRKVAELFVDYPGIVAAFQAYSSPEDGFDDVLMILERVKDRFKDDQETLVSFFSIITGYHRKRVSADVAKQRLAAFLEARGHRDLVAFLLGKKGLGTLTTSSPPPATTPPAKPISIPSHPPAVIPTAASEEEEQENPSYQMLAIPYPEIPLDDDEKTRDLRVLNREWGFKRVDRLFPQKTKSPYTQKLIVAEHEVFEVDLARRQLKWAVNGAAILAGTRSELRIAIEEGIERHLKVYWRVVEDAYGSSSSKHRKAAMQRLMEQAKMASPEMIEALKLEKSWIDAKYEEKMRGLGEKLRNPESNVLPPRQKRNPESDVLRPRRKRKRKN